jgi:hypothetical protein
LEVQVACTTDCRPEPSRGANGQMSTEQRENELAPRASRGGETRPVRRRKSRHGQKPPTGPPSMCSHRRSLVRPVVSFNFPRAAAGFLKRVFYTVRVLLSPLNADQRVSSYRGTAEAAWVGSKTLLARSREPPAKSTVFAAQAMPRLVAHCSHSQSSRRLCFRIRPAPAAAIRTPQMG